MKLATFSYQGKTSIGLVLGDQILDLPAALPGTPHDMIEFLSGGEAALQAAASAPHTPAHLYPRSAVHLLAPILRSRKYLAIGFNFQSHVEEIRTVVKDFRPPPVPVFFNKQVTCIQSPYGSIELPEVSKQLDYEVEMVVVIGKRCRHVSQERALDAIAGYCVGNDVSVRDWQMASQTMTMGKSFDTHGPIGPWITTKDEIAAGRSLAMTTWVNGEVRQQGHSGEMLHSIGRQIEYLSTAFTLEVGDLIATGTPAGVGVLMQPQRFLQAGDVVRCEIEQLGHIENTVRAEYRQDKPATAD
jgi:2-keto-4-pentenoate hydratase/2-oxohepta-3-ene-1,7-dioic acid hydratase in catechol pathway